MQRKLLILLLPLVLSGCRGGGQTTGEPTSSPISTTSITSSPTIDPTTQQLVPQKVKISTFGGNFATMFSDGYSFINSNGDKKIEDLLSYLNLWTVDSTYNSGLFNDIDGFSAFANTHETGNEESVHLKIGDRKGFGSMTFKTNKMILSVSIEAQAYYKTYSSGSFSGFNVDETAAISLDDVNESLASPAGEPTQVHTIEKSYSSPCYSFSLSATKETQRVFVNSITIEFLQFI